MRTEISRIDLAALYFIVFGTLIRQAGDQNLETVAGAAWFTLSAVFSLFALASCVRQAFLWARARFISQPSR